MSFVVIFETKFIAETRVSIAIWLFWAGVNKTLTMAPRTLQVLGLGIPGIVLVYRDISGKSRCWKPDIIRLVTFPTKQFIAFIFYDKFTEIISDL